jgi:hypothetical protein
MELLIWIGAALTMLGVAGLVVCVVMGLQAKRSGQDDEAIRASLKKIVALNLAALMLSFLGLMAVVVGIILS